MQQEISSDYIARTRAVSGCFSMFILMFGLTFVPLFFAESALLQAQGLLFPLLFAAEFVVLVPLYYFFFSKRAGLGKGTFNVTWFGILFVALLLVQFAGPWLLGIRQNEEWVTTQVSLRSYALWLSSLSLIFIAPVYEEMIFRGCLFNAFQYWFKDKTWLTSAVVSAIFALMHTQYVDFRTLLLLFIVSLVLIYARIKSNGILMPIMLHILMNGTVVGMQIAAQEFVPST